MDIGNPISLIANNFKSNFKKLAPSPIYSKKSLFDDLNQYIFHYLKVNFRKMYWIEYNLENRKSSRKIKSNIFKNWKSGKTSWLLLILLDFTVFSEYI